MTTTAYIEEPGSISAIRRANFRKLVLQVGAHEIRAKMKWKTGSYLSQLKSEIPCRPFPEKRARELERAFGITPGDMDIGSDGLKPATVRFVPADTNQFSQNVSGNTISAAMQAVDQVITDTKAELKPEKKAVLYQIVFTLVVTNGWSVNLDLIGQLVTLGRL